MLRLELADSRQKVIYRTKDLHVLWKLRVRPAKSVAAQHDTAHATAFVAQLLVQANGRWNRGSHRDRKPEHRWLQLVSQVNDLAVWNAWMDGNTRMPALARHTLQHLYAEIVLISFGDHEDDRAPRGHGRIRERDQLEHATGECREPVLVAHADLPALPLLTDVSKRRMEQADQDLRRPQAGFQRELDEPLAAREIKSPPGSRQFRKQVSRHDLRWLGNIRLDDLFARFADTMRELVPHERLALADQMLAVRAPSKHAWILA